MDEQSPAPAHRWLNYTARRGDRRLARRIIAAWVGYGSAQPVSVSKLRKMGNLTLNWKDSGGSSRVAQCRFDDLVESVVSTCDFDTAGLGLPPLGSRSLRRDFDYSHNLPPMTDHTGTLQVQAVGSLGETFPLVPRLDREGMIFTSFEGVLFTNVLDLHDRLIGGSAHMVVRGPRWVNDLRVLINDTVSAVDICLNHLYLMAEYNPKPSWRFDRAKLGARHGRRMTDKLKWVHAITNKHINAQDSEPGFHELRELRNHLNHFDPPCVAYSVDDAARWLNLVPKVAQLLWRIRICMDEPLSRLLIRWLLLRPVEVTPRDPGRPRPTQLPTAGYSSTRWPPRS